MADEYMQDENDPSDALLWRLRAVDTDLAAGVEALLADSRARQESASVVVVGVAGVRYFTALHEGLDSLRAQLDALQDLVVTLELEGPPVADGGPGDS